MQEERTQMDDMEGNSDRLKEGKHIGARKAGKEGTREKVRGACLEGRLWSGEGGKGRR